VVDSLLVALLVVALSAFGYKFGRMQQQIIAAEAQAFEQRARAELAEQRLADVLAIPLPAGYGRAIGAKDKPRDTYEATQDALLRANFDND
jgi:hypothetical protein